MDSYVYFAEHQKELLEIANSQAGRFLLSGIVGKVAPHRIDRITPNSFRQNLNEIVYTKKEVRETFQSTFVSRHPFADLFLPLLEKIRIASSEWRKISNNIEAFEHYANLTEKRDKYPVVFLSSLTANPVSGSNSPVDGCVERSGVNEVFTTIRAGAGNTASNNGTVSNGIITLVSSSTSNQYQSLRRQIECFDTSSLTTLATISAAVISHYGGAYTQNFGSAAFHVAAAAPASTSTVANGDFQTCSHTSFGNVAIGSWSNGAYNDITLNASGVTNITKTGISKFSCQLDHDINNAITGSWVGLGTDDARIKTADDGSNVPKLVITYTLPSSALFFGQI